MYQGTEPRSLPPRSLHSGGESWLHHCLHFTEDGIESQRGYTNVQRHTAGMRRSKDLNPVSLVPGSYPPCHTDATPFTALPPQQRCPGFITAHRGRGLAQNGTLEQRAPCTLALFSSEDVSVLQADRSDSHRAMHSSPPSVPSFSLPTVLALQCGEQHLTGRAAKPEPTLEHSRGGCQGNFVTCAIFVTIALKTHFPRSCVPTGAVLGFLKSGMGHPSGSLGTASWNIRR